MFQDVPRLSTYGRRAFSCTLLAAWNSLPDHLLTIKQFRHLLKSFLFFQLLARSTLEIFIILHYTNPHLHQRPGRDVILNTLGLNRFSSWQISYTTWLQQTLVRNYESNHVWKKDKISIRCQLKSFIYFAHQDGWQGIVLVMHISWFVC